MINNSNNNFNHIVLDFFFVCFYISSQSCKQSGTVSIVRCNIGKDLTIKKIFFSIVKMQNK